MYIFTETQQEVMTIEPSYLLLITTTTILYCTVLYRTVPYRTILYYTAITTTTAPAAVTSSTTHSTNVLAAVLRKIKKTEISRQTNSEGCAESYRLVFDMLLRPFYLHIYLFCSW